jgi:lipid-binding SYLF domain-containing protein
MKHKTHNVALALFVALLSTFTIKAAEEDLVAESKAALASFKAKDTSLQATMAKSSGFAIFPDVGKGGFIVGGARGKGIVYEKDGGVIGKATMTQATVGAQAGGQSFSQLILFETPAALNDFKAGNFEMAADISAVVAAEGASSAAKYKQGVAVFAMPKKGAMVSAAIGGQKFKFEPMAVGAPPKSEQDKGEKDKPQK